MTEFDSPWKEALDCYFEPFIDLLWPQAHRDIDWLRGFEFLDKEFQQIVKDAELGRWVVDKLVKVWLKDGTEEWILIHIEVQTQGSPPASIAVSVARESTSLWSELGVDGIAAKFGSRSRLPGHAIVYARIRRP